MSMFFSAVLAAGLGILALLLGPFSLVAAASGILWYPDRGKVSVRAFAVAGLSMKPGGLFKLPSSLGHRGTLLHHDEKVNYLALSLREIHGRVGLPG